MTRKSVVSDQLPATLGPYSHAIVAGGFVLCSGTASALARRVTVSSSGYVVLCRGPPGSPIELP